MKHCNPLLRSWERFKKMKHRFGSLRRIGRGYVESELGRPRLKNLESRTNRRAA
jgi:hypothetical protein